METCICDIAVISWGKLAPRPCLGETPTWCKVSDKLNYSPIHQVYTEANTAVTVVLGQRWRRGGGSRGGEGWGDGIGCYLFLGARHHEKHERFAQELHEVINIYMHDLYISFFSWKKYILFLAIGPPPPGIQSVWW